ncbi:MAG: NAD(P)H-dependent oxidoreductase [Epsilonproteobacteria bacterium]|nr:NAD(P)H-dependent oxidoreductase [Campylobacterota bacterium]
MDKNLLIEALNFRHACKLFDTTKKISDIDLNFILESARLAPSSFGMEHCRIVVVKNQELKKELKPLCWNQNQIDSCDSLLVLIAKHKEVSSNAYYTKMFERRGVDENAKKMYIEKYENYLKNLKSIKCWSEKQCYITASNIMNYSALIGIDSCPIEGFEKENVEKKLGIDNAQESVALLLALGYRANPQTPKLRLNLKDIVTILN